MRGSRRVRRMRRGANTFPSHNRLPIPSFSGRETMFFPRFTLSVSFPSFGINNARWRLCCSSFPAGFSRDATAGDSAGDIEKLTCAGPSSLSESLLALCRIGFGCFYCFIYCIHLFIVCIYVCIHHYIFIWLCCVVSLLGWELHEVKGPIPRL